MHLFEALEPKVAAWREAGFDSDFRALKHILLFARGGEASPVAPFLRPPQLKALETYWYLRVVEDTPHILSLYQKEFPGTKDLLAALNIPVETFTEADFSLDRLWEKLQGDADADRAFVQKYDLEALRETLKLSYPSYILALAMGAGKTILIASIIATEFAMALEYPDGPFVKNALVFAPGKTIFGALRELADTPFDRILPPAHHKRFAAHLKLTFTRDGEKDLPIIRGSSFNVVVTNTEKIRIQKRAVRGRFTSQLELAEMERRAEAEANLRLQALASLPHLAVFSDEAHHTYGQALGEDLKKVRRTVDYLHEKSPNLICIVNTTGTPYYGTQPLRDVVVWYGLAKGIEDGFLKKVSGNIKAYSSVQSEPKSFLQAVLADFFRHYADIRLPTNGAKAKIALYFPQNDDLEELLPEVHAGVLAAGQPLDVILRNTSRSSQAEVEAFGRLNDPASPHRIILLVDKGTEGWNCPSLFACALARRIQRSNNFVLQASTRCLREVPGNTQKASIYLSDQNADILDRQLRDTYRESIEQLNHTDPNLRTETVEVRKTNLPRLVIRRKIPKVVETSHPRMESLKLVRPDVAGGDSLTERRYELDDGTEGAVLRVTGKDHRLRFAPETADLFSLATDLAEVYRLDAGSLYQQLTTLYPGEAEAPLSHRDALAKQIEEQTRCYEIIEEVVDEALALLKLEGFEQSTRDGKVVYTTTIHYNVSKQDHLLRSDDARRFNPRDLAFHYDPYLFDSGPEREFLTELLRRLEADGEDVQEVLYTGGLTHPKQTDFLVQYQDENSEWHDHTPDFVVFLKNGKVLIVEVKSKQYESVVKSALRSCKSDSPEGRKALAVQSWEKLNTDKLKYQVLFADTRLAEDELEKVMVIVEKQDDLASFRKT